MGDNSYGQRGPWTSQAQGQPMYNYSPVNMTPVNAQTMMDPRLAMQMRPPMMNGYPTMSQAPNLQQLSMSGAGITGPLWDMDVPSQMFMQAMNFDKLMADRQAGMTQQQANTSVNEDLNESSRDLIEQQQAMEQARLLQRFKELRNWQQQQQEMLMSQQHQQLSLLRKEQERMQCMIAKQRENQWGGGSENLHKETATPPRRDLAPGVDMSRLMNTMGYSEMSQPSTASSSLPKPVIYVQPNEDDDEVKTNPDLFSDTNSNRGSLATVEDGMFPIPDSASEASTDIGFIRQPANPVQFRPRLNKHELDAPKKHHRSFAELEADTEFLNLSCQSPTFLDMHNTVLSRPNETRISEEIEADSGNDDSADDDDDNSDDDDDDDSEEDSDEQEDTQIEVQKASLDDVPIKPGIEGGKTFEQMLEEQLKAEEERLKRESEQKDSPAQPKRTFLKKGQGIARFDQKHVKKPLKKKSQSSSNTHKLDSASSTQLSKSGKSSNKVSSQSKSTTSQKATGKNKTEGKVDDKHKHEDKQLKLDKGGQAGSKKPPSKPTNKPSTEKPTKSKPDNKPEHEADKPDSIPDDTSYIACLKERQKESEHDLQDLDEFEILEHFAEDMSFCSNSSIVTKGLRGLQGDRILTGPGTKGQGLVRPASPRAAFIKKLQKLKETKAPNSDPQKLTLIRHSNTQNGPQKADKGGKGAINNAQVKGKRKVAEVNQKKDSDEEEWEEIGDDNSDETEDSDNEQTEVQKSEKFANGSSQLFNKEYDKPSLQIGGLDLKTGNNPFMAGVGMDLNTRTDPFSAGVHLVMDGVGNGKSRNDSVCSTDKKLARVLSYTAMTEAQSESEQDEDSESDSDDTDDTKSDEDFVINESPSKVVTRKIATKQITQTAADFLSASLNNSAFIPNAKSPLVISKEKVKSVDAIKDEGRFSYHSDSDSVGNRWNNSFSDEEDKNSNKGGKSASGEKKTLDFDDDNEWSDSTPKPMKSRKHHGDDLDHDKTLVEESEVKQPGKSDTPPTSKLMTKLFPKLKPPQQEKSEQDLQKVKAVSQAAAGEGIQSKLLRDKLVELEREIEKFRNENSHLAKLRTEREEGLTKLKKEITEFEKEKLDELKRIEEFKNEEMKKLKHERKMFDKYQKAARAGPDKKEREEIETLKLQLSELQEEMKRKEARWTASQGRLRDKMEHVEQENEELKEEVKLLERKRLEWMQKSDKGKSTTAIRSSSPSEDRQYNHNHVLNGLSEHGGDQLNDLSATGIKPSNHAQPKTTVRGSYPPSQGPHSSTNQPLHHNSHAHSKPSNINHSAKPSNLGPGPKGNQISKKPGSNAVNQHTNQYNGQNQQNNHRNMRPGTKGGPTKTVGKMGDGKNVTRGSLAEDVPRRELGTAAEHQDMSMCSEGDMSVQGPSNLPRKFASSSRYGVDRSVIDKGDNNDYDEIQHSDGKVERTYRSGAREILFSNGTRKEISSDGKSIIVSFFNGDVKQIMPDQRVIYYYAENQTTHTNYPDGLEILHFPNEQTEKLYPDSTKEITFPDQTVKYIFPNGSEESIFPDGIVIRLAKNGDKTMEFPNGQREIHTQEFKRREYPDGTVKTIYPDGRQETRYSNGRLRVKDKDGNVVVDSHC